MKITLSKLRQIIAEELTREFLAEETILLSAEDGEYTDVMKGDPFDYEYDVDADLFLVKGLNSKGERTSGSRRRRYERAIGRKFKKGRKTYDILMARMVKGGYSPDQGEVEPGPRPEPAPTPEPAPEPKPEPKPDPEEPATREDIRAAVQEKLGLEAKLEGDGVLVVRSGLFRATTDITANRNMAQRKKDELTTKINTIVHNSPGRKFDFNEFAALQAAVILDKDDNKVNLGQMKAGQDYRIEWAAALRSR